LADEVRNVSLPVASAVNSEGFREILGICEDAKEDKSGWSAFLRHPADRGITGVQLIISDARGGLTENISQSLLQARTKAREISHMLNAIHTASYSNRCLRLKMCEKFWTLPSACFQTRKQLACMNNRFSNRRH
jgi:transposase-like protein